MSTSDLPRYVAFHDGTKARVLRRCADESCYAPFAEMLSIFAAKDLAHTLNQKETR